MRPSLRAWTFALAAFAACARSPHELHAQGNNAAAPTLASVDSLLARSRFRDAAAALDAWERAHTKKVSPSERATALMLRARMASAGDSARALYLELSASYPSSSEAPVALLRLGQIAVADRDTLRAISYFQRVTRDYPNASASSDAREWLGRIAGAPSVTRSNGASTPARTPASPPASSSPPPPTDVANARGAFALQVGAFKEPSTATTVSARLKKLGFEPRIVTVPGSSLTRVRVGRFATTRASDDLLRRLRSAGYEAVVVDDAAREITASK